MPHFSSHQHLTLFIALLILILNCCSVTAEYPVVNVAPRPAEVPSSEEPLLNSNRPPAVRFEDALSQASAPDSFSLGGGTALDVATINLASHNTVALGIIPRQESGPLIASADQPEASTASGVATTTTTSFPPIFHQVWISTNELPPNWDDARTTWMTLHPEWQHFFWTDARCRELIATHYEWFLAQWDEYDLPIQHADVCRYFVLYHYGGVYADLDIRPLRNIEPVLEQATSEGKEVLLLEKDSEVLGGALGGGVCIGMMASVARSGFWQDVFKMLQHRRHRWYYRFSNHLRVITGTGPQVVIPVYRRNPAKLGLFPAVRFYACSPCSPLPCFREGGWVRFESGGLLWNKADTHVLNFLSCRVVRPLVTPCVLILVGIVVLAALMMWQFKAVMRGLSLVCGCSAQLMKRSSEYLTAYAATTATGSGSNPSSSNPDHSPASSPEKHHHTPHSHHHNLHRGAGMVGGWRACFGCGVSRRRLLLRGRTALLMVAVLGLCMNLTPHLICAKRTRVPSQNALCGRERTDNVLMVTAHPDDEAMFFVPTIRHCAAAQQQSSAISATSLPPASSSSSAYASTNSLIPLAPRHTLHLLCLSTGNADGLGKERVEELKVGARFLGFTDVEIIDHPLLPDGMQNHWDHATIRAIVTERVRALNITAILTFDSRGVSGHPNHLDVQAAVLETQAEMTRPYLSTIPTTEKTLADGHLSKEQIPRVYQLRTVSFLRKFLGVFDQALSLFFDRAPATELFILWNPSWSWESMRLHKSQFVWFRWLWVVFSRYTYVNTVAMVPDGIHPIPTTISPAGCFD